MSFLGNSTFKVGGVVFPLTNSGSNELIVDADPVIYNILQFCKSNLVTYIGDRFLTQATKANLLDAKGNLITSPVQQLVPYSPADYLEEVQYKFPLLSADRRKEKYYKEHTRQWFNVEYELEMLYMLPPMTADKMFHMNAFRALVPRVLQSRMELGHDPNYNNDELVYQTAGIEQISMQDSQYIGITNPKDVKQFFPSIMMTFNVTERKNYVNGSFPDLTGIDGEVDISDGYQPNNYDMIDFKLDL